MSPASRNRYFQELLKTSGATMSDEMRRMIIEEMMKNAENLSEEERDNMLKNLMTNLVNVLPADLAAKVLADIMKATESMDPTLKERMIQNMLNDLEALPEGLRDAALKEIMKNMDNLSSEQRQKLLENILNKVLCCLAFGLFVCSSPFPVHNLRRIDYRKFATYRPGGMQFLATHNF